MKLFFTILLFAFCFSTVGYSAEVSGLIPCVEESNSCEDSKTHEHDEKSKDCHCVCHVHSFTVSLISNLSVIKSENENVFTSKPQVTPAKVYFSIEQPPQINS